MKCNYLNQLTEICPDQWICLPDQASAESFPHEDHKQPSDQSWLKEASVVISMNHQVRFKIVEIIGGMFKPQTHVWKLSFQARLFPDQWKRKSPDDAQIWQQTSLQPGGQSLCSHKTLWRQVAQISHQNINDTKPA